MKTKSLFRSSLLCLRGPALFLLLTGFIFSLVNFIIENRAARDCFYEAHAIVDADGDQYIVRTAEGTCALIAKSEIPTEKAPGDLLCLGRGIFLLSLACLCLLFLRFRHCLFREGRAFYEALPLSRGRICSAYLLSVLLWSSLILLGASLFTFLIFHLSPYLAISIKDFLQIFFLALFSLMTLFGFLLSAMTEETIPSALFTFLLLLLFPPLLMQGFGLSIRQHFESFAYHPLVNECFFWWHRLPFCLFDGRSTFPNDIYFWHYGLFGLGSLGVGFVAQSRPRPKHLCLYLFLSLTSVVALSFEFSLEASFTSRLITFLVLVAFLIIYEKKRSFKKSGFALIFTFVTLALFLSAILLASTYIS